MRASAMLLLALAAAAARADDAAGPPADSIAAAKKDFAAIKAPVSQPDTAVLPMMDMKDLGPVPGAARPEAAPNPQGDSSLYPAKKKTGTGNWLVDAMEKNTSAQASKSQEKDDVLRGDPDLVRADEKGIRLERDPLLPDDSREKERSKDPPPPVYNPLDSFMSGWISARDHDLLLPSGKGEGLAGADAGRPRAELLPGLEIGPSPPEADFTSAQNGPGVFGDSQPGANPYVAVMDLLPAPAMKAFAAPEVPGFASAELGDPARGISSSGMQATPADSERSYIPDFAQPDDDSKYFKQLKKF
jgi:hypothetical protein